MVYQSRCKLSLLEVDFACCVYAAKGNASPRVHCSSDERDDKEPHDTGKNGMPDFVQAAGGFMTNKRQVLHQVLAELVVGPDMTRCRAVSQSRGLSCLRITDGPSRAQIMSGMRPEAMYRQMPVGQGRAERGSNSIQTAALQGLSFFVSVMWLVGDRRNF